MKTKLNYLLTCIVFLMGMVGVVAQAIVINAPVAIDNPNLPGVAPWQSICAGSGGFNEYFVNITWAGTANTDNQFILELSDATGDFTNPVTLATITDQNTNQDFDVSFGIGTDIRGEAYRLRVRSTDPVRIGTQSEPYNMYYMNVTSNLNISEIGDGVPPGSVCSTGPITLQVDNIANPETYQYIWYRSGTEIIGEKSHTLLVSQSGMYAAFIDYGPNCTGSGNTDSNIVDVTIGSAGNNIAIDPPSKTALCSTDIETLSIDQTNSLWSYQWYKDGVAIPGAIGTSYSVNASNVGFEGDYTIEISGNTICNEQSAAVTITNADEFTVTRNNDANIFLLPSQTQTLSISTTANTPTFRWFRNGVEISGETMDTLTISQDGTYYAEVSQTGGVCAITSKVSENTIVASPASFTIAIDYTTAYTSCVSTNTTLEVVQIDAVADDGSATDVTSTLINSFSYSWLRNGNALSGATNSTIAIASNNENGSYSLQASLNTYNESSNTLPVQLLTTEEVTIESTSTVYCNVGDSATLSTTTDLTGVIFEWKRDGNTVSTADEVLVVNAPGTYQLVLDRDGCPLLSNSITISPLDENLISIDSGLDVVLPEGTTRTITASGGTGYTWFYANNTEISNTASATVSDPGIYTVVASIDSCEIIRQVSVSILETFKVPNVITVNGDGINDQWIIPNSYSNKPDVNVIIYNEQGQEILNEFNYMNNWPQSSTAFTKQNMVFYYKIRNTSEVLKQGTITVIR